MEQGSVRVTPSTTWIEADGPTAQVAMLCGVMSFSLRRQRIALITYVVNPDKLPTLDEMA
jgi:hypothetical protein